jgi:hypothetical protein
MALFKPAEVTSAYLKMGMLGLAGSGKTYTASIVSRDLIKHMKQLKLPLGDKPAMFLDTETGSDWIKKVFDDAGIPLFTAKTRAFADLIPAVKEAEANASVLIIDSITHFWKELCESYQKANKRNRLEFQDWAYLKGKWGEFTDLFVNSSVHILLCGRAGFEYDYIEDDRGKKNLEKTGVKMKAEGEMGYEPSLLVHMERVQKVEGGGVEATWRTPTILKDRSTLLDGKEFINPKFTDFLPHIQLLNLGGKQLGVDTTRSTPHSQELQRKDWSSTRRKVVLDEIQTLLVDFYPSTSAADKKAKIELLRKHFADEEITWTKIEEMIPLIDLQCAYDGMFQDLKGKPSQYAGLFNAKATNLDIDDALPEHSAPIDSLPEHSAPPAQAEAPKPVLTIEQQLLADLANLTSAQDCAHWAGEVAMRDDLEPMARVRISTALIVHMGEIAAKPAAGPEKPEPEKADAKPKAKRKLETAEDFKKASAELQAEMGGKAPDVSMAIGG